MEVLREESTLNEIATNNGASPQLISRWKAEFIENMPAVFDKKNTEVEQLKKEHSAETEDLINQIGQLTVDMKWLKKKQEQAKVIAIGPGKKDKSGNLIPMPVKVNDIILMEKYSGQEITLNDEEFIIIKADDIIAIIEN